MSEFELFDPIPEILEAVGEIDNLSISDGMPDYFVSGDSEQMDWEEYKGIGWVDLDDHSPDYYVYNRVSERGSEVSVTFHVYFLTGGDAAEMYSKIDNAITPLGYTRRNGSVLKESISTTQNFTRLIARYRKKYFY